MKLYNNKYKFNFILMFSLILLLVINIFLMVAAYNYRHELIEYHINGADNLNLVYQASRGHKNIYGIKVFFSLFTALFFFIWFYRIYRNYLIITEKKGRPFLKAFLLCFPIVNWLLPWTFFKPMSKAYHQHINKPQIKFPINLWSGLWLAYNLISIGIFIYSEMIYDGLPGEEYYPPHHIANFLIFLYLIKIPLYFLNFGLINKYARMDKILFDYYGDDFNQSASIQPSNRQHQSAAINRVPYEKRWS